MKDDCPYRVKSVITITDGYGNAEHEQFFMPCEEERCSFYEEKSKTCSRIEFEKAFVRKEKV